MTPTWGQRKRKLLQAEDEEDVHASDVLMVDAPKSEHSVAQRDGKSVPSTNAEGRGERAEAEAGFLTATLKESFLASVETELTRLRKLVEAEHEQVLELQLQAVSKSDEVIRLQGLLKEAEEPTAQLTTSMAGLEERLRQSKGKRAELNIELAEVVSLQQSVEQEKEAAVLEKERALYAIELFIGILVPMNKLCQPVKKARGLFNRFIADIAKRPQFCPINYSDWRLVPTLYKNRILEYLKKKFVIPSTNSVQDKILSSVGERLRGYKRYLRQKYITKGITKDELYNLPLRESNITDGLTRPIGVDDAMWAGFVTLSFSQEFEKKSQHGKIARGKQTHCHTNGSQSFGILLDKFERKHKRQPGPIERFVKTREKKDKTFHEPIKTEFVRMEDQIAVLKSNLGDHGSRHDSPINGPECDEDARHDSPLHGYSTHEALKHDALVTKDDAPTNHSSKHDSTLSNAGHQLERDIMPTKQGKKVQGELRKQTATMPDQGIRHPMTMIYTASHHLPEVIMMDQMTLQTLIMVQNMIYKYQVAN
ncbi:unnamed protein product [Cuscuta campestris]|uniref:Uncharacterized protein n=1 Tax=Cuscuta campestris TaxID=132261 RepID=A0A484MBT2_9ASTE|nr:unnamed protein product [Cuscuta campestris]